MRAMAETIANNLLLGNLLASHMPCLHSTIFQIISSSSEIWVNVVACYVLYQLLHRFLDIMECRHSHHRVLNLGGSNLEFFRSTIFFGWWIRMVLLRFVPNKHVQCAKLHPSIIFFWGWCVARCIHWFSKIEPCSCGKQASFVDEPSVWNISTSIYLLI